MANELCFLLCLVVLTVVIAVVCEILLPKLYKFFERLDNRWYPKLAKNCPYCNTPRSIVVWEKSQSVRLVSYHCKKCWNEGSGLVVQVIRD